MAFIKKEINSKIVGIIDIGTYKIRTAIVESKNKNIKLIGYGEKRQNNIDLNWKNLKQICLNIEDSLNKAKASIIEWEENINLKDIIVSTVGSELFFESSKINHSRYNTGKKIDKNELDEIIKQIKDISFKNSYKNIKNNYSYEESEIRLIMSIISNIKIGDKKIKNLIGTDPNNINVRMLNIFLGKEKFDILESIARVLDKNLLKIIPIEYSLYKLKFNKNRVVLIDLGNSHTSIIIKEKNYLLGVKKIEIGINDLIKKIKQKNNLTKIEIINSIDKKLYTEEKKEFLEIFCYILSSTLQDILKDKVCPNNFFITGGGANNFIKEYIKENGLDKTINEENISNTKLIKNIKFINPEDDYLSNFNESKMNINIYSMINIASKFINKEKDLIERSLQKAISD